MTIIIYYHPYIIQINITFDILPVLVNAYMCTSEHGIDSLKL